MKYVICNIYIYILLIYVDTSSIYTYLHILDDDMCNDNGMTNIWDDRYLIFFW